MHAFRIDPAGLQIYSTHILHSLTLCKNLLIRILGTSINVKQIFYNYSEDFRSTALSLTLFLYMFHGGTIPASAVIFA